MASQCVGTTLSFFLLLAPSRTSWILCSALLSSTIPTISAIVKSHTHKYTYTLSLYLPHKIAQPTFFGDCQSGWWGSVSPKTLAPHQQRQLHCVVSSCCPLAPPESEISAWQIHTREEGRGGGGWGFLIHLILGANEMRRIWSMCTHTHLSKNYRRFYTVSETTGTPLWHTNRHTYLSAHGSSETGEGNKQAPLLVFLMSCWAAHFDLLSYCGCLPLERARDVSWCLEKERMSPGAQKRSFQSHIQSSTVHHTGFYKCVQCVLQASCSRMWNSGVCIKEYVVHPPKSALLFANDFIIKHFMINIMKWLWMQEGKSTDALQEHLFSAWLFLNTAVWSLCLLLQC